MTVSATRIGFDRFIALEWATVALKVRAALAAVEELDAVLDAAALGTAARKKTRTVLNRLWLEPRPELAGFAERGAMIFKEDSTVPIAALTWGMAIATYPFFGTVAEIVGRLSALQGDCSSAEVHRRMSERYGEREGTYRMTNMVLQSQASWGAIARIANTRRLVRQSPIVVSNPQAVAWLAEGALRYAGKAIPIDAMSSLTVLYPFRLAQPVAYVVSRSPTLDVSSGPAGRMSVRLHAS